MSRRRLFALRWPLVAMGCITLMALATGPASAQGYRPPVGPPPSPPSISRPPSFNPVQNHLQIVQQQQHLSRTLADHQRTLTSHNFSRSAHRSAVIEAQRQAYELRQARWQEDQRRLAEYRALQLELWLMQRRARSLR